MRSTYLTPLQARQARRRNNDMRSLFPLLTGAVGGLIQLLLFHPLFALWIAIFFGIPYLIGLGLNRFVLKGRSLWRSNFMFMWIAEGCVAILYFFLSWFVLIHTFSTSAADWWYRKLFLIGAVSNTIMPISAFIAALSAGRD